MESTQPSSALAVAPKKFAEAQKWLEKAAAYRCQGRDRRALFYCHFGINALCGEAEGLDLEMYLNAVGLAENLYCMRKNLLGRCSRRRLPELISVGIVYDPGGHEN